MADIKRRSQKPAFSIHLIMTANVEQENFFISQLWIFNKIKYNPTVIFHSTSPRAS
ncbi:hypothetical protein QUB70_11670 [Microcoleus sp. A003_D6]|uniref:hypothetical protein n=1 Tax=Microcoleus sp. A003_D6 TaxID=3055266 RepID=UPI002FCEC429